MERPLLSDPQDAALEFLIMTDLKQRARRRLLRDYGLPDGERRFAVRVEPAALRLRGEIDEPVIAPGGVYVPVDYPLSNRVSEAFKVQIRAGAMLAEQHGGVEVATGYVYLIARRGERPS